MRILVIEDNPDHAELICTVLRTHLVQCDVVCASSLSYAIDRPTPKNYQAVISDLSLPDASGLTAVRRLVEHFPDSPLIVLTCLDDELMALKALESGAQDYLVKDEILTSCNSASEDKLIRAIRYAVRRQEVIAENRQLYDELFASKRLLEAKNSRLEELCDTAHRFVDNVSHEFRTPLTVVKEYASLIREGVVGDVNDQQSRMLNVIEDRTDDLNTMVDDMLDVSKIEAGLLGIWRRDVQLHDIIRHAMSMLQRKASVRGVTLEVVVPESLPTVCCDEEKVARVIVNLVTNGIKFCASDGVVRLWARSDEENREVLVGVTDDGPGIPLEKQRAIFDRFSQLDTVQKQSTKGFGLGLAIAKELVHANLGELSIESIPGQGSTFTFTLPFAEPDKIFRQYLSRVTSLAQDAFELCFIRATAGVGVSKKEADDLDVFLGHNIRRNDIVIRASDLTWVVVLFVPKMEHADSIDRIERAHAELSRNRPFGPLPSLEWDVQGTCSVDTPPQMLLEQFDRCFSSRETCHV